jgi:hypothetical protein
MPSTWTVGGCCPLAPFSQLLYGTHVFGPQTEKPIGPWLPSRGSFIVSPRIWPKRMTDLGLIYAPPTIHLLIATRAIFLKLYANRAIPPSLHRFGSCQGPHAKPQPFILQMAPCSSPPLKKTVTQVGSLDIPICQSCPHALAEAGASLPVLARILPSSRPVGVMMY